MSDAASTDAKVLHEGLIVVDGHCDTAYDLLGLGFAGPKGSPRDFLSRGGTGHVDLPRLREGGVTCQIIALFVDDEYMADPRAHSYRLLEAVEGVFERTGDFASRSRPPTSRAPRPRAGPPPSSPSREGRR